MTNLGLVTDIQNERLTGEMVNKKWTNAKRNQIELRTFVNGSLLIHNVPYTFEHSVGDKHKHRVGNSYLAHGVLFQLSHILKYMEESRLDEIDYQDFLIENSRLNQPEELIVPETVDNPLHETTVLTPIGGPVRMDKSPVGSKRDSREIKAIIDNVLTVWIGRHFETKMQVNAQSKSSGEPCEATRRRQQWLDTFNEKLGNLPELHQNIIKSKYLQIESDGRFPLDVFVYNDLHISRRMYYDKKKEALYWLGLSLK